jgi:hypothetical protein
MAVSAEELGTEDIKKPIKTGCSLIGILFMSNIL